MSSPSLCSYPRPAALPRPIGGKLLTRGVLPSRPAPAKARPPRHRLPPSRIDSKARPTFYRLAPPTIDIKFCNFRRDVL